MKQLLSCLAVLTMLALPSVSHASSVTFSFSGRVSGVDPQAEVLNGNTFSGSLTVDTTAAGTPSASSGLTTQYHPAITDWDFALSNGLSFSGDEGTVTVGNDTDPYGTNWGFDRAIFTLFGAPDVPLSSGRSLYLIQFDFQALIEIVGATSTLLSSDNIPTSSLDVSLTNTSTNGRVFLSDGSNVRLGTTAFTVTTVPLPAGGLLMLGGLAALAALRKRRTAR